MNFSDEYKKQNDSIVPDADFLKQLQKKMEQEKVEVRETSDELKVISIKRFSKIQKVATAAAMISFIVIASFISIRIFGDNTEKPGDTEQAPIVGDMTDIKPTQSTISMGEWYSAEASEDEIKDTFLERISGNGLTRMYYNSENKFSDQNLMTDDYIDNMIEVILNQDEIMSLPTDYVAVDYYMAVFEDGTIIKFTMNEELLHIQNTEFAIKIKK